MMNIVLRQTSIDGNGNSRFSIDFTGGENKSFNIIKNIITKEDSHKKYIEKEVIGDLKIYYSEILKNSLNDKNIEKIKEKARELILKYQKEFGINEEEDYGGDILLDIDEEEVYSERIKSIKEINSLLNSNSKKHFESGEFDREIKELIGNLVLIDIKLKGESIFSKGKREVYCKFKEKGNGREFYSKFIFKEDEEEKYQTLYGERETGFFKKDKRTTILDVLKKELKKEGLKFKHITVNSDITRFYYEEVFMIYKYYGFLNRFLLEFNESRFKISGTIKDYKNGFINGEEALKRIASSIREGTIDFLSNIDGINSNILTSRKENLKNKREKNINDYFNRINNALKNIETKANFKEIFGKDGDDGVNKQKLEVFMELLKDGLAKGKPIYSKNIELRDRVFYVKKIIIEGEIDEVKFSEKDNEFSFSISGNDLVLLGIKEQLENFYKSKLLLKEFQKELPKLRNNVRKENEKEKKEKRDIIDGKMLIKGEGKMVWNDEFNETFDKLEEIMNMKEDVEVIMGRIGEIQKSMKL